MSTIHVTNGDHAANALREALQLAHREEHAIGLKDDLAVGPLRNIDEAPDTRGGFWRHVLNDRDTHFEAQFEAQEALILSIVRDTAQVVVWHGESAGDQLTLRRIAYHLRNAPQRLNEARLTARDLPPVTGADGSMLRRNREDGATAVGMYPVATLLEKLAHAAPVSVLRIGRLALEWQEAKYMNAETRRWRDNVLISGSYAEIDDALLDLATAQWQPARRIVAAAMTVSFGFLLSDSIAFWRCRELVASGRLKIQGTLADIARADLRR
jgi:hypothetical protein